jgi:hypothetical protein
LARRVVRLAWPIVALAGTWLVVLGVAAVAGVPGASLRTAARLVVSPLWFIVVLVVLGALTAPVRRLIETRHGPVLAGAAGLTVVGAADAGLGWTPLTVLAAWFVPYALGVAAAAGRMGGRRAGWSLFLAGGAAVAGLVALADYPASAVGVPGAGGSNLNPPSLAAVALSLGQVGAALLLRPRLGRPRPVVRRLNRAAMGIYLWHQTALIAVTVVAARLAGTAVHGLHTAPVTAGWVAVRLLWLPVFAATLWVILRALPARATPGSPGAKRVRAGCTLSGVCDQGRACADDSQEVIAVRDGDPPSRGRAARQLA